MKRLVAEILGFEHPDQLEEDAGFFQLGMDSIMAVKLRGRLETDMGRSFPPSLAFEYPNVQALADYLASLLAPADQALAAKDSADPGAADRQDGQPADGPGQAPADLLDDLLGQIGDLEDGEIDRLLTEGPSDE